MFKKLLAAIFLATALLSTVAKAGVEEGIDVRKVQTMLAALCYDPGAVDGIWGAKTARASKNFLQSRKIVNAKFFDDTFDRHEERLLRLYYADQSEKLDCSQKNSVSEIFETVSFGVQISSLVNLREVQRNLKDLCLYRGKLDGSFGAKTYVALVAIYDRNGILFDGLLNQRAAVFVQSSAKRHTTLYKSCKDYSQRTFPVFPDAKYGSGVYEKLAQRKTINTFAAWSEAQPIEKYQLAWSCCFDGKPNTIILLTPLWNYYYPGRTYYKYPSIERFLLAKKWDHDSEYGKTLAVDYSSEEFRQWFSKLVRSQLRRSKADGVMLDWWHNSHSNGFSEGEVRQYRQQLADQLRQDLGENAIIMGNVNWGDRTDVKDLNGVFLELWKSGPGEAERLYNSSELRKIERLLHRYEQNLRAPKLIALEGWRKTKTGQPNERNSKENRRMAKLLTALSVVVPSHGYILYADNNQDALTGEDHEHLVYDFYDFDVGKPVSDLVQIKNGSAYKLHEKGVIAYNITDREITFRASGIQFKIMARSGLFCETSSGNSKCLPFD